MKTKKPLLISVVGPTAIGKTATAIALAKALNTEILSADSRQFYKEMAIGTAVPSEEELNEIPHHFIHSRSIFDDYSVGDFERDAIDFLNTKFFPENPKNPTFKNFVMVGGSGLYVDAVVKGLDEFPETSPEIREELNKRWEKNGISILQKELKEADPIYFSEVDRENPHRLIRALEVFYASGKPYSSFLNQPQKKRKFTNLIIGLTAEREIIYDRINRRVDLMMESGLEEEAKSLFEHKNSNALQTVGYRELFRFFEGEITREEAVEEIKKNTRRFAKRQLTWFRKNLNIHWFDYSALPEEMLLLIKKLS